MPFWRREGHKALKILITFVPQVYITLEVLRNVKGKLIGGETFNGIAGLDGTFLWQANSF